MKHRDSFFEKMLTSFMRSAEGARYRKGFLFAFLASCCPIALLFAWLFHFLGALGTFSIAAALMALALAHLDACESEASAQEHTQHLLRQQDAEEGKKDHTFIKKHPFKSAAPSIHGLYAATAMPWFEMPAFLMPSFFVSRRFAMRGRNFAMGLIVF